MLKGRCQIWHPDQTRYSAPLLSLPESPERFLLHQASAFLPTPTSDASDASDVISQLHPAHGKAKTHMAGLSTLPSLHFIPLD